MGNPVLPYFSKGGFMSPTDQYRELDPWEQSKHYVLSEKLHTDGQELSFGDEYPEFCHLGVKHVHFSNGVVGNKAELESLEGVPVKLYNDNDFIMPVAMFVANPSALVVDEMGEQLLTVSKEDEEKLYMENAELLKTKKDLIGYAKEFGIKLPNKQTISIKKMLEMLKEEATKKGLLE